MSLWIQQLNDPVDGIGVASFRFFLGLILFLSTLRSFHRLVLYYTSSPFYFYWEALPWIRPLSPRGMQGVLSLQLLFSACFACGLFYPLAACGLFLTYTYLFLLDQARYNNHYYLVCLFLFLMNTLPAHCTLSLDQWLQRTTLPPTLATWQVLILQLQLAIVFTWGGLNKLHKDWLYHAYPIRNWFRHFQGELQWQGKLHRYCFHPAIKKSVESALHHPLAPRVFSWGGAFVDLTVIWGLQSERFFFPTALAYFSFNLFNQWFLSIGIFPWINYACFFLFLNPDTLRQTLSLWGER